MLRNENRESAGDFTVSNIPAKIDLGAATLTKMPDGSKANGLLEYAEVAPANTRLEHLMENLMTEIEAKKYDIGDDVRCRIRDDVIHTHKREARLLGVMQRDTEFEEGMKKRSRRLEEIDEEGFGQQSQVRQTLESSSGPESTPVGDSRHQTLEPNSDHPSQDVVTQEQTSDHNGLPAKVCRATLDQVITSIKKRPILVYIDQDIQGDPWNSLRLSSGPPNVGQPRAPEENRPSPFGIFGTSMRAFHRILPLEPLRSYIQNGSGTSMLVTEKSHILDSIASASDLAALTDSTDSTDTRSFVSARSEIGEPALDVQDHCLVEGEQNGSLVLLDGQGSDDSIVNEGGKFGNANADPFSNGLLQLGLTSYDGQ